MLNCPFLGGPSAALAAQISDETGSGLLAFATSPTFVTPVLGTPSSGTLSSCDAATDSVAGVMSSADHTTLTSLSGFATGVAPTSPKGVLWLANVTGVNLKTNATTDIFTVPASKTAVVLAAWVVPTSVTGGAAVAFKYGIIESGASGNTVSSTAAGNAAPVTTKNWVQHNLGAASSPFFHCAAGNKVQINITTGFTTSTTVTGSMWVMGFYF